MEMARKNSRRGVTARKLPTYLFPRGTCAPPKSLIPQASQGVAAQHRLRSEHYQLCDDNILLGLVSQYVDQNLRLYIVLIGTANRTGLFGASWRSTQ